MMFHYCRHIQRICEFSIEDRYCGIGKGDSIIDHIVRCDGKKPVYSKEYITKLKELERIDELKRSGQW